MFDCPAFFERSFSFSVLFPKKDPAKDPAKQNLVIIPVLLRRAQYFYNILP